MASVYDAFSSPVQRGDPYADFSSPADGHESPGLLGNMWASFKDAVSPVTGLMEAGTQFTTGAVAAPVAGWAGILQGAYNAVDPNAGTSAADRVRQVQEALTYQPRTESGQVISGVANYPLEKLAQGADWAGGKATDITGRPAVGAAVNTAIQFAPALAFKGVQALRGRKAGPVSVTDTPAQAAEAYVRANTSLDWNAIPAGIKQTLEGIAQDATQLSRLDPAALERQVRLQSLSRPVPATQGQLTRDIVQLRNEGNVAATEAGKPIRDIHVQQNRALLDNLEILKGKTGGTAATPEQAGQVIQGAARANLAAQEAKVKALYKKADASGETAQAVDVSPILSLIEQVPDVTRYGWVKTWLNKTGVTRAATEVRDPLTNQITKPAAPPTMSIRNLERLRQDAQAELTSADGKARFYAGQLVQAIDSVTEGAGGKLYQEARAARKEQAMRFQEPRGVARLVEDRSRTDPATALEDTWRKTVIGGSIEDLRTVKRELLTTKQGVQAWREMRTQTAQHIINEATKSVTRYEDGSPNITPASMERAIKTVGRDKLMEIMGPKLVAELDNIMEATRIAKTEPPPSFKGSPTAANLMALLERWAAKVPVVGNAAVGVAVKAAEKGRAVREIRNAETSPLDKAAAGTKNALYKKRAVNSLTTVAPYAGLANQSN